MLPRGFSRKRPQNRQTPEQDQAGTASAAIDQGMGNGAQVHIFQFAAGGYAARQAGDLQAQRLEHFGNHMGRGLTLGGEIGGEDHFAQLRLTAALAQPGR